MYSQEAAHYPKTKSVHPSNLKQYSPAQKQAPRRHQHHHSQKGSRSKKGLPGLGQELIPRFGMIGGWVKCLSEKEGRACK